MSRPYGQPKTEAERLASHEAQYGNSSLPTRGTGLKAIPLKGASLWDKINQNIWLPIKAIFAANRDYPYHDYKEIADTEEPQNYRVGTNQVNLHGDQTKYFVSKSTLIISDVECTIRFNHTGNVPITILADTCYEFKSNITSVYVSAIATDGTIYMYFEGVLPQEQRDAE